MIELILSVKTSIFISRLFFELAILITNMAFNRNDNKQRLQYLIYPEGIWYNKKEEAVRTSKANPVFACIADATKSSGEIKTATFKK